MNIGKLMAGQSFAALFPAQLTSNAIDLLPVEVAHIAHVATLPLHHRDPFDRLIIAQAQVENLPLISADPAFDAYGVRRLW
jgi:PIN domain nuclease of toxin-antitoxin system